MRFDFGNQTVLVTGATRNLGYRIAAAFGGCGARVVVHGRDRESVEAAIHDLASRHGTEQFIPAVADLSRPEAVHAMFDALDGRGVELDALVHNAAHLGVGDSFLDMTDEFFDEVMRVNLIAAFGVLQLAARRMARRGRGAIINISSLAAERALPQRAAYNASKAAQDALIRSIAIELAPLGVTANTIAPGYIQTDRWDTLAAEHVRRRRANCPSGAEVQPGEIAELAMWLASGAAPRMIGARLVIDGGVNAQQFPADVAV